MTSTSVKVIWADFGSIFTRLTRNLLIFNPCAQDETRTHTILRPLPPQSSVYTNFTTCARVPRTGLEPAHLAACAPETHASTNSAIWARVRLQGCKGQYHSAQLTGDLCLRSPHKLKFAGTPRKETFCLTHKKRSGKRDSNSRPRPWQGRALPTELFPLEIAVQRYGFFQYYKRFFEKFLSEI